MSTGGVKLSWTERCSLSHQTLGAGAQLAPAKAACGSWSLIHGPCTKSNTQALCPPRGGTPFSNALTRPHRPAEALTQFHKPPLSSHSITGLGLGNCSLLEMQVSSERSGDPSSVSFAGCSAGLDPKPPLPLSTPTPNLVPHSCDDHL